MVRPARPWRTQFSPSPMRSVLVLLCLGTPGPPASPVVTHCSDAGRGPDLAAANHGGADDAAGHHAPAGAPRRPTVP